MNVETGVSGDTKNNSGRRTRRWKQYPPGGKPMETNDKVGYGRRIERTSPWSWARVYIQIHDSRIHRPMYLHRSVGRFQIFVRYNRKGLEYKRKVTSIQHLWIIIILRERISRTHKLDPGPIKTSWIYNKATTVLNPFWKLMPSKQLDMGSVEGRHNRQKTNWKGFIVD